MYEFFPSKKNNKSSKLALCLIIGAFLLFASASLIPGLRFVGVFQTVSFFFLGIGILIITRFVTKSFIYGIKPRRDEDILDLTVTELQGKSQITVCRLSLSGIRQVTVCSRAELKEQKKNIKASKIKYFNYCADIFEEKVTVIYATECGEDLALILSYDEKLTEYLSPQSNK